MGAKTKIDWCDSTWNPVTGCLHGCAYCYARKIAGAGSWQRQNMTATAMADESASCRGGMKFWRGSIGLFEPNATLSTTV